MAAACSCVEIVENCKTLYSLFAMTSTVLTCCYLLLSLEIFMVVRDIILIWIKILIEHTKSIPNFKNTRLLTKKENQTVKSFYV